MKRLFFCVSAALACGMLLLSVACTGEKRVRSGDMELTLSETGEVIALTVKGEPVSPDFFAATSIEGTTAAPVSSKKIGKGWEFIKDIAGSEGKARVTERFFATGNSIRWEVTVLGDQTPWSAPIQTQVRYPAPGARMWAPWGGPLIEAGNVADPSLRAALNLIPGHDWHDPLLAIPFTEATYYYGSPYVTDEKPWIAYCPEDRFLISIPYVCIIDAEKGYGLSVALSLEDRIQDIDMVTGDDGTVRFNRRYHRIVESNPVTFAVDFIAHEPDWRSGLAWMTERYREYFYPTMPHVFDLNGTSAYASNHDMGFDVQKMKDMAFSTNWRASFDFPYMGMFIPPVKDQHTKWFTYRQDSVCVAEMNDYAERMKAEGFHVLNYLNLNEFANGVKFPAPPPTTDDPDEWWKNPNDYLWQVLEEAVVYVPEKMNLEGSHYPMSHPGSPYYSWGDCIVVDCGVPVYKEFLLEQVRRHLEWVPAADGFCIDRYDWWHYFNERYDDGESWYEGKPVRSLRTSLREIMKEFAPMVHDAGKVIFVNTHAKRIDLLKDADGIHDEYTNTEGALNTTAFLALKKPALGWTWKKKNIEDQGADYFFQKYLYMGVFPMCPFPGNDHSIRPDEWVDRAYLDYGPLMQQMKYRTWVLSPDPVTVTSGNAKANIFELPDGYIVPVVYADGETVELALAAPDAGRAWRAEAYHPGKKEPVALPPAGGPAGITLSVPVERGCAMVRLY